ncbi:hypothetical protein AVEN_135064-1 [Araneus ventricosus]|uniref:CCHC-type domain-containing protein n=1 Tax=Araneus ventricosus TaxID=182803 RepID=A0A4Y2D046_ARAVE|nr:hypothetical protein AVEN_135064-1 [Araneus ventricosus]
MGRFLASSSVKRRATHSPNLINMATSNDFQIKALKSESLLGLATTGVKGPTKKSKALSKKLISGSDDDFQEGSGIPKTKALGKQRKMKPPVLPSPAVAPFHFGQTNPFGLQPVGMAPLATDKKASGSTLPEGYVGFGLNMGLPPGVCWGDTPYPGAVQEDVSSHTGTPVVDIPEVTSDAPPVDISVPEGGVGQVDNDGFSDASDISMIAGTPPEEVVKSGQKRRQAKVPKKKKKLITDRPEGSIETLLQDNSSSDSDKTVIVPESMASLPADRERPPLEVPATPPPVLKEGFYVYPYPRVEQEFPDSVEFTDDKYQYENTGVCPWVWFIFQDYLKAYSESEDRSKKMAEFLRAISDYFVSHQNDWKKVQADHVKLPAEKAQLVAEKARLEEQLRARALVSTPPPLSKGPEWSTVVKYRPQQEGPPPSVVKKAIPTGVGSSAPAQLYTPQVSSLLPVQQPPQIPFAARVKLKPRQGLPTVLVRPLGDTFGSSAELKHLLEVKVSPKQLGVQVVACLPAVGNGVIVRTESTAMAQTLRHHINDHPDLNGVCRAEEPKKPNPRILLYDVPALPGDRVAQETLFLAQLEKSNSFSEGAAKVLFRRKGRGEAQHWVISLDPVAFNSLGASTRLHWGFGSFRFRPFSEPQQCYKCLRFGHTQSSCRADTSLCSRCPGEHTYRNCREPQPRCRNCIEFNKRNRRGQLLNVNHTAISRKCPIYLRECEEFQGRLNTVS